MLGSVQCIRVPVASVKVALVSLPHIGNVANRGPKWSPRTDSFTSPPKDAV